MTTFDHLRHRLLARAGLLDPPRPRYTLAQLEQEWSPIFERLMRNRMMMGCLRYGPLSEKQEHGSDWDGVGAIETKLRLYKSTGNTEYLVDIANYCLLEFECGRHPTKHFHALDDHANHCRLKGAAASP